MRKGPAAPAPLGVLPRSAWHVVLGLRLGAGGCTLRTHLLVALAIGALWGGQARRYSRRAKVSGRACVFL